MTKIERIESLLGQVEDDIKQSTVQDIMSTLKDFLAEAPAAQKPGLQAAIQIIDANYIH